MSELKNSLDKVFREKLGNYRKDPPEEIWAVIRSKTGKSRERKLIFVAWRVAAGIAIIITAGYSWYYLHRTDKQIITENPKVRQETVIKPETLDKTIFPGKSDIPGKKSIAEIPVNKSMPDKRDKSVTDYTAKEIAGVSGERVVEDKVPGITEPLAEQTETGSIGNIFVADLPYMLKLSDFQPDRIPERKVNAAKSLMDLNTSLAFIEEPDVKKDIWSITAQLSPTYNYRNLSQGDPNSIAALNETESGKFSYGGGLQLGVKATERLSIFAGLMYSQIGFEIRNIYTQQAGIPQSAGEILISPESNQANLYQFKNSTGSINSDKSMERSSFGNPSYTFIGDQNALANQLYNTGFISSSDKIDQYFQFIELPFMLRYKVLNKKLKINLLGGLSTNVLIGNRVFLVSGKSKSVAGETQGIRTVNYSGNLGFGFDYDLGRNFLFILEPQFKYYLNSINENVLLKSRPYSVGMFTGIRYVF